MEVKLRTKPSTLQKLFKKEGIGVVDFILDGADPAIVRILRPLVPVSEEQILDFNPFVGSLRFSAKANKKLLQFLEEARKHLPEESLPPDYQQIVDYLNEKYQH